MNEKLLIGMSEYPIIPDYPASGIAISNTKDCKELYVILKIISTIDLSEYTGQFCKMSGVKTLPYINNVDKSRFEIVQCIKLLQYNDSFIYHVTLKDLV